MSDRRRMARQRRAEGGESTSSHSRRRPHSSNNVNNALADATTTKQPRINTASIVTLSSLDTTASDGTLLASPDEISSIDDGNTQSTPAFIDTTSFSASPLATITSTYSVPATIAPAQQTSTSTNNSSKAGLIVGLIAGFIVVISILALLILRLRRAKPTETTRNISSPEPTTKEEMIASFPLPPTPPLPIHKKSNRMSVVSWISGKSKRSTTKFDWYRSGVRPALIRTGSVSSSAPMLLGPDAEVYERNSPLDELSEKAAFKILARRPSDASIISHVPQMQQHQSLLSHTGINMNTAHLSFNRDLDTDSQMENIRFA